MKIKLFIVLLTLLLKACKGDANDSIIKLDLQQQLYNTDDLHVYCEIRPESRKIVLCLAMQPLIFEQKDGQNKILKNRLITPDEILLYTNDLNWVDAKYRISSRDKHGFVRTNIPNLRKIVIYYSTPSRKKLEIQIQ